MTEPVSVRWMDGEVYVQPPTSQGVLLTLVVQATRRLAEPDVTRSYLQTAGPAVADADGSAARR